MSKPPEASAPRALYMVLSPRALPYARIALGSLLANATEPLKLTLITDSREDRHLLQHVLNSFSSRPGQDVAILSEAHLADAEADRFRHLPNLRALRHGHPCWRKITDPLLLSPAGQEILLLDPDLYFPNPFTFESTPPTGLLLMWQQPNCLFPPEIVRRALDAKIPLARHVDIGVSHWRGDIDLQWLDRLVSKLGGASLPRIMHVEAILWSAMAMHMGGGYLDAARWVCWRRSQATRVRLKLSTPGADIFRSEPWHNIKCFHAGGEAKWWLPELLSDPLHAPVAQLSESPVQPFVPLTAARYTCEQGAKRMLGYLGYYRLFTPTTS